MLLGCVRRFWSLASRQSNVEVVFFLENGFITLFGFSVD